MFVLVGTKTVMTEVPGGRRVQEHCDVCGRVTELREVRARNYLTLFFIPLIPLGSSSRRALRCTACKTCYTLPAAGRQPGTPPRPSKRSPRRSSGARGTLQCPYCSRGIKIPVTRGRTPVTCPHCSRTFTVRIQRGP